MFTVRGCGWPLEWYCSHWSLESDNVFKKIISGLTVILCDGYSDQTCCEWIIDFTVQERSIGS
jgi:hypothetical protein